MKRPRNLIREAALLQGMALGSLGKGYKMSLFYTIWFEFKWRATESDGTSRPASYGGFYFSL